MIKEKIFARCMAETNVNLWCL